jgi:transposase
MKDDPDISSTTRPEIESLISRIDQGKLTPSDTLLLKKLLQLLIQVIHALELKRVSLSRLKRMLFGSGTEKYDSTVTKDSSLVEHAEDSSHNTDPEPESNGSSNQASSKQEEQGDKTPLVKKRKGHGKRPASEYTGAKIVDCINPDIKAGDRCEYCSRSLYDTNKPSIFIHRTGQPIVGATKYQRQVIRCSGCQAYFTAPLPAEVKGVEYDATADVSIAVAKYGLGLPLNRVEGMQQACGIPLPASTQYERCCEVAEALQPIYKELEREAANGRNIYIDDTGVSILECVAENKSMAKGERRGMQTTGIVSAVGTHKVSLYISDY